LCVVIAGKKKKKRGRRGFSTSGIQPRGEEKERTTPRVRRLPHPPLDSLREGKKKEKKEAPALEKVREKVA